MSLGPYKVIKLILLHRQCLDWWSCVMIFLTFSSVLICTLCLESSDSYFSSIQSPTLTLFTRGIIQHMATVCLWCQIAHKEWLHCLLREMVANWCSPLLVECYQRTQALTGGEFALRNQKKIVARLVQRHQNKPTNALTSDKHITWCSFNRCVVYLMLLMLFTIKLWYETHDMLSISIHKDCILSLI